MGQRKIKAARKTPGPPPGEAISPPFPESLAPWKRDLFCGGILLLAVALLYGHTLHAPWYLDDTRNILDNSGIRNLSHAFKFVFTPRGPATLTFALNFALFDYQLPGYHLGNIFIHLLTAGIVYLLLKRVFRQGHWLPLFGALIFLAHPLQTQAVTYIVQRQASLAGLFFFLTIYLYTRAREVSAAANKAIAGKGWAWYGLALVVGALAVFTKQNTAVLAPTLWLFDRYFLAPHLETGKGWLGQALLVAPFALVPCWVAFRTIFNPKIIPNLVSSHPGDLIGELSQRLDRSVHREVSISPREFLISQFTVIWLYIRLLFLPYNQALEYNYPITGNVFAVPTLAGLAGIVGLLIFAWAVRKKWPWASFAIFWFFLTLSVEASIIPLDPVFEHRLYIPVFGFAVLVIGVFSKLLQERQFLICVSCIILVLGALTWKRNLLWNDQLAFYEDNIAKRPPDKRMLLTLSKLYIDHDRVDEAEKILQDLIEKDPSYIKQYVNLSYIYIKSGELDKAAAVIKKSFDLNKGEVTNELLINLGTIYQQKGQPERAVELYEIVLEKSPRSPTGLANMGLALDQLGQHQKGEGYLRQALRENPTFVEGYVALGINLARQRKYPEAAANFREAVARNPSYADGWYYLGKLAMTLGEFGEATRAQAELERLDPARASKLAGELRRKNVPISGAGER